MLTHPQFDPIAIKLGPLAIHWYGLMYLLAFVMFLWLGNRRVKSGNTFMTRELVDRLLMYGVLGVILGGRLGYILFYKPGDYLADPLSVFYVWQGGMSFHGGFLGVVVAMMLFAWRIKRSFWEVADFVAPLVPLGLAVGRIGNFINGELWGRVTSPDAPWAMLFPQAAREDITYASQHPQWLPFLTEHHMLPRHPSQLYQFALEGVLLFIILWAFSSKPRPVGQVSALFLTGYGLFRFIAEFAREPDDFLGLLAMNLSMGQWLSLPMIVIGVVLFIYFGKKTPANGY